MKRKLLEILACPICRGGLALCGADNEDEVRDGELCCTGCKHVYPIRDYIPRFAGQAKGSAVPAPRQLSQYDSLFAREQHFLSAANQLSTGQLSMMGFDQRDYSKGWCLEGGSGAGRISVAIATRYLSREANLVCLEPSEGVDRARGLLKEHPNVHFIQGDIRYPPFRKGSFSFVLMSGVLPHVPGNHVHLLNNLKAFLEPGGRCQVNSSWYPVPGLRDNFERVRRYVSWSPGRLGPVVAAFFATLGPLSFRSVWGRYPFAWLLKLFTYSPRRSWHLRYTQYLETLTITPYDIFKDYNRISQELLEAGFEDLVLYPHSVSVKCGNGNSKSRENPCEALAPQLRGAKAILLGTGWFGRLAFDFLTQRKVNVVGWATTADARQGVFLKGRPIHRLSSLKELYGKGFFDLIILSTDFFQEPYERVLPLLEAAGFRWGEEITTLQIAVSTLMAKSFRVVRAAQPT